MGEIHKPKSKQVVRGKVHQGVANKVLANPIAYVVEDKVFGKLEVKNSANAWWMNRTKVEDLIKACKMDCTLEECFAYAGISKRQYDYFTDQHTQFCDVKKACNEVPGIKARATIYNYLDHPDTAKWYMERKKKNEFGVMGVGTAVQVNIGGEIVNDVKIKKVVDEFEARLQKTLKQEVVEKNDDKKI